jgi:hypothetical protein
MLQEAGFVNVELVGETGFNASPKTKGVLVRAGKPESLDVRKKEKKRIETNPCNFRADTSTLCSGGTKWESQEIRKRM